MTIRRIWHGWTTHDNADAYQRVLLNEVIPGIEAKNISGYRGITVLRQEHASEVEFVTIVRFDSIQNVIDFQGEDYKRCYVPDAAQKVLSRWDQTAEHYEVVEARGAAAR